MFAGWPGLRVLKDAAKMNLTLRVNRADLDSGLELAVQAVKSGRSFAQAVDAAVKHIRTRQTLSRLDESRVRVWLEGELPHAIRRNNTAAKPEEKPAADLADQLYRQTGPGRFTPVGKPPFIFPPLWLYRLVDGRTARKHSADCIRRRKIIVAAIAVAGLLAGLFPPWVQTFDLNTTHTQTSAGYAFIGKPPAPMEYAYSIGIQMDWARLGIEMACIAVAGVAVWFWLGGERQRGGASLGEAKDSRR